MHQMKTMLPGRTVGMPAQKASNESVYWGQAGVSWCFHSANIGYLAECQLLTCKTWGPCPP